MLYFKQHIYNVTACLHSAIKNLQCANKICSNVPVPSLQV